MEDYIAADSLHALLRVSDALLREKGDYLVG